MSGRSKMIRKMGFTLRSSLSWIRPTAAAVIAYAVLDLVELWQWGGVFILIYLMEIVSVYLAVPSSDGDDYENESGLSGEMSKGKKKLPKLKKKF
ncbi:MAG: hypothetical protein ACPHIY_01445 [Candidatus Thalassarchaeaceae archaeon]